MASDAGLFVLRLSDDDSEKRPGRAEQMARSGIGDLIGPVKKLAGGQTSL